MCGATSGGSRPSRPSVINLGMRRRGSSNGPYTEYSRNVTRVAPLRRAVIRHHHVALAFVTA